MLDKSTPTILITGANGFIGRMAYAALQDKYKLVLVDNKVGKDQHNRFGHEGADYRKTKDYESLIKKIDLAKEPELFQQLVKEQNPACIIHLAGLLENQSAELIKNINTSIDRNMLSCCLGLKVPVLIAASSIMVNYGAAMEDEEVRHAFNKDNTANFQTKKHSVFTPLKNNKENIAEFDPNNCDSNISYIHSKEELEHGLQECAKHDPQMTCVAVRFGWTGVKNPLVLEENNKYSELPVYLDREDLKTFIQSLTAIAIQGLLKGYKCYAPVSKHPRCWIDNKNIEKELNWRPTVDTSKKYSFKAYCITKFLEKKIEASPKEFLELGVAIEVTDEKLKENLQVATKKIHAIDSSNPTINTLHISLGQGLFQIKDLKKLTDKIAHITNNLSPFILSTCLPIQVVHDNVFLDIKINNELIELEQKVMSAIQECRYPNGIMKQYREAIKAGNMTEEKMEQIERIGIPNCGKYFRPHITLAYSLSNPDKVNKQLQSINLNLEKTSLPLSEIGIYKLGQQGNIIEKLASMPVIIHAPTGIIFSKL